MKFFLVDFDSSGFNEIYIQHSSHNVSAFLVEVMELRYPVIKLPDGTLLNLRSFHSIKEIDSLPKHHVAYKLHDVLKDI